MPDGISPFQAMFGVGPISAHEPPEMEYVKSDSALKREFEVSAMKAVGASQIVSKSSPLESNFKVGDIVLMQREESTSLAKLLRKD